MPQEKVSKKPIKSKKRKENFTYALGRRKTATARIRLFSKKGDNLVNNKPISDYFPGSIANKLYLMPLYLTNTAEKFHFTAKVIGSGKHGQLGAVIHGVSRALSKLDPETHRPLLKKHGLLTRDSRMKEQRKVGTGGKARRKKQSPKR